MLGNNKPLVIEFIKHSCQIIPALGSSWRYYESIVFSHSDCLCVRMSGPCEERMGLIYIFNFCSEPSCLGLAQKTYSVFVSCAFKCRLIFRVPLVFGVTLSYLVYFVTLWLPLLPGRTACVRNITILFRLGIWILSWRGWGVLWFPWWCLLTLLYLWL